MTADPVILGRHDSVRYIELDQDLGKSPVVRL